MLRKYRLERLALKGPGVPTEHTPQALGWQTSNRQLPTANFWARAFGYGLDSTMTGSWPKWGEEERRSFDPLLEARFRKGPVCQFNVHVCNVVVAEVVYTLDLFDHGALGQISEVAPNPALSERSNQVESSGKLLSRGPSWGVRLLTTNLGTRSLALGFESHVLPQREELASNLCSEAEKSATTGFDEIGHRAQIRNGVIVGHPRPQCS